MMVQDMVCTGLRATADAGIYTATTQSWYILPEDSTVMPKPCRSAVTIISNTVK